MSANIFQRLGAGIASRRLRAANVAAEVNEAMAGIGLLILRDGVGQYALDLYGVLEILGIESESAANSDAMRICNDAGYAENIAEQKICDLAPDSRELAELIDVARQFPAVFIAKLYTRRLDRCRLCAVKPARANYVLYLRKLGIGKRRKGGIFLEQIFANYIDTRVGALGGKPAHDHQLPSLTASPIEGASRIGI